ncbi:MAG: hypothetical protein KC933_39255, partial [Myxococcales bacterium]|nr:hypothetical protein [Myxococcales bacterium]
MRSALTIGLAALVVAAAAPAQAEDWPASVQGLKVVVPPARGKPAWGSTRISKAVQKHMKDALGELVSPTAFAKAQKKLKLKGKARYSDANLAKAGQAAGAQWVLDLEITKQKWLYTATARLINTETGQEQMNFRSQYYKPTKESADRGFRIAKRTVEKLDTLTREGPLPVIGPIASGQRPSNDPRPLPPPGDIGPEDVGEPPPPEDPLAQRLDGALPPDDGPPPPLEPGGGRPGLRGRPQRGGAPGGGGPGGHRVPPARQRQPVRRGGGGPAPPARGDPTHPERRGRNPGCGHHGRPGARAREPARSGPGRHRQWPAGAGLLAPGHPLLRRG